MGTKLSVGLEERFDPTTAPRNDRPPTFDPLAGFPNGRKKREMVATWEEMDQWKLTIGQRDYCAHYLIDHLRCQKENMPFAGYKCDETAHHWNTCHYEDMLIRVKEFERERRLLKRRQRKTATAEAAAHLEAAANH
jgi:NADH dehydrogenase (ubiquinone) 1 beta subcomplex subunit 7